MAPRQKFCLFSLDPHRVTARLGGTAVKRFSRLVLKGRQGSRKYFLGKLNRAEKLRGKQGV